eukprot:649973-Hanusia_phi.AAC.3
MLYRNGQSLLLALLFVLCWSTEAYAVQMLVMRMRGGTGRGGPRGGFRSKGSDFKWRHPHVMFARVTTISLSLLGEAERFPAEQQSAAPQAGQAEVEEQEDGVGEAAG